MTPEQAEIAFVLEDVVGVVAVYALEPTGAFRFAVHLQHGGTVLAAAHFALRRVLSHAACRGVLLFEVDLPPFLRNRATRLVLSPAERADAREQVALRRPADEEVGPVVPYYERKGFSWMIVDPDPEVHGSLRRAFGLAAEPVIEPDRYAAFWKARAERFSLIVCDGRLAFGKGGLLAELQTVDPTLAQSVVLLVGEGERELTMTSLDELRSWNSVLCRPADVDTLREVLATGSVVLPSWGTAPATAALVENAVPRARRVLVVDDDPTTAMLLASGGEDLDVLVTSDEWEAADRAESPDLDLVVCSIALRTRGGTPFYRFLWNANPSLKRRFVFIASANAAPPSASSSGPPVVERPLTRAVIATLLARVSAS